RADVSERVRWRNREVAALVGRLVAEVRPFLAVRVPAAFDRVDHVAGAVRAFRVADLVEDEELRLGTEVRRVADTGRLQVRLGLGGDRAGVLRVRLLGDRVDDVAGERQG